MLYITVYQVILEEKREEKAKCRLRQVFTYCMGSPPCVWPMVRLSPERFFVTFYEDDILPLAQSKEKIVLTLLKLDLEVHCS
jgi:hypothetical protein